MNSANPALGDAESAEDTTKLTPEEVVDVREALKVLADWSKWSVTVQTALIGTIAFVLKADERVSMGGGVVAVKVTASIAILCFCASIVAATILLLAIPGNLSRLSGTGHDWRRNEKNYLNPFLAMPVFGYGRRRGAVRHLTMFYLAMTEQWAFIVGMILLSVLVVVLLWGT